MPHALKYFVATHVYVGDDDHPSRKHPGFTLTALGVLTLGIGVNAGIFGIINGLMIRNN